MRELHSDEINARLREITGCECTAKDFRTWHATVLAATAFAREDRPDSERGFKRVEKRVMEEVSTALGNTPTIARTSYVDPRVVRGYRDGYTIARSLTRASRLANFYEQQATVEKAVVALVRKVS